MLGTTSLSVLARRLDLEGGRQGGERPAQAAAGCTVVPPGREAAFLAPFDVRLLPGVGPRAEERLRAAGVTTIGALAALDDDALRALLPGKIGAAPPRPRARHRPAPRGAREHRADPSISSEETFERDLTDRERAPRRGAAHGRPRHRDLQRSGETARTITTKLRYADFSIRTRSTSLPVGTDDEERIGELACALLDRALADRPGALRLVGVGVSGLEPLRQLALV